MSVVVLFVQLLKKYDGKYLVQTCVTLLISYFAGYFSHNLLMKLKVGDLAIIVTLTMLALLIWGFVISVLFLLRKKWLFYTINVCNFLVLIAPIVLIIAGVHQKNTVMLGIGVLTVYPTGILFVYAINRFNSKVNEVLTQYTFGAVITLVLLVLTGLSLISEDFSSLGFSGDFVPMDAPISSDKNRLKGKGSELCI